MRKDKNSIFLVSYQILTDIFNRIQQSSYLFNKILLLLKLIKTRPVLKLAGSVKVEKARFLLPKINLKKFLEKLFQSGPICSFCSSLAMFLIVNIEYIPNNFAIEKKRNSEALINDVKNIINDLQNQRGSIKFCKKKTYKLIIFRNFFISWCHAMMNIKVKIK